MDDSGVWVISLLLSNVVDGTVAGVGMPVDLAVADTLETAGPGQTGPKAADPGEHVVVADQVISSPSYCVLPL